MTTAELQQREATFSRFARNSPPGDAVYVFCDVTGEWQLHECSVQEEGAHGGYFQLECADGKPRRFRLVRRETWYETQERKFAILVDALNGMPSTEAFTGLATDVDTRFAELEKRQGTGGNAAIDTSQFATKSDLQGLAEELTTEFRGVIGDAQAEPEGEPESTHAEPEKSKATRRRSRAKKS